MDQVGEGNRLTITASQSNRLHSHAVVRITSTQYIVEECDRLRLASTIGSPPWLEVRPVEALHRLGWPLQIIRSLHTAHQHSHNVLRTCLLVVCSRFRARTSNESATSRAERIGPRARGYPQIRRLSAAQRSCANSVGSDGPIPCARARRGRRSRTRQFTEGSVRLSVL